MFFSRLLFSVLFLYSFSTFPQCVPNSFIPANGFWDDAANWTCGNVPADNDNVEIPAGKVCTLDIVTPVLNNVRIWVYGEIYVECGKKIRLDCNSALVVWPGGIVQGACVGSKIEYCGAFVWDGGDPPLIGPVSIPISAMPIELVSFEGWHDGESLNHLSWVTASETDNDFFLIEKSVDGINFESFTIVDGAGTSSVTNSYEVADDSPFFPLTFYRLEQTDLDGNSTTGPTISVEARKGEQDFRLYPNPASRTSTVFMRLPSDLLGKEVLVVVYDVLGNELYSKVVITGSQGTGYSAIDPSHSLKAGIYTVTASANDKLYKQKIIIQ